MTHKERILATVKGESTDKLPFIPRLDIWYNSNKYNGTLPAKYKNATLKEITEDLNLGYHSVVPDFKDYDGDDGDIDVGLGIYKFRARPYTLEFHNIQKKIKREANGILQVEYITPKGNITTTVRYDEEMRKMGLTLYVTLEHAVKSMDDYEALAYIFENIDVKPDYAGYIAHKENVVGENGVAVALLHMCASSMHYLVKELMAIDTFFYESIDNPDELQALADRISPFLRKLLNTVAGCPAEFVLSGANYDSAITIPSMFNKHIVPELKYQSDYLHEKGKFLVTHTDGENTGLLDLYVKSGFDVADSICPFPMTKNSLKEIRDIFGKALTI
jgi:hypothetical protein